MLTGADARNLSPRRCGGAAAGRSPDERRPHGNRRVPALAGPARRGRPTERVFVFSLRTADGLVEDASAEAGLAEHPRRTPYWLDQGKPVNVVQLWVGHSSPKVTLAICLPLVPGELSDMDDVA